MNVERNLQTLAVHLAVANIALALIGSLYHFRCAVGSHKSEQTRNAYEVVIALTFYFDEVRKIDLRRRHLHRVFETFAEFLNL